MVIIIFSDFPFICGELIPLWCWGHTKADVPSSPTTILMGDAATR
jgi:hypothetical protein